jgi:gliding motility-associated-like protein
MYHKSVFLFLLFIIFSLNTFSAVFVVTSKADSGPGTLREALTKAAANGSATKDYINFNLPDLSEAGRTILLTTQLPDVSSNLVIDGTTQPGPLIGQSNAHVEITTPFNDDKFTVFNGININDIEFYGLFIRDYADVGTSRPDLKSRTGINIVNGTHFIFGAAGKGNLIRGFNFHSLYLENVDVVKIQGNVMGLSATNDFSDPSQYGLFEITADADFEKCNNITIGGDTQEGNTSFIYFLIRFLENSINNNVSIKSNNLGVFQDGKTVEFAFQSGNFFGISTIFTNNYLPIDQEQAMSSTVNVDIENNLSGNFGAVFSLEMLKGLVTFQKNFIGVTRDGTTSINDYNSHQNEGAALLVNFCFAQINVGGADMSTKNFFAYSSEAVFAENSTNIFIRNNEYECLSSSAYYNPTVSDLIPKIAIGGSKSVNGQTILSGTANPGATVDIYSSESCAFAQCSIRSYVATVMAGNNGKWITNPLNFNGVFYVSATLNNRTSQFETFEINTDKAITKNLRCGDATITGIQIPQGLSAYWTDENGNVVSTTVDLKTSKSGQYLLNLGGGCITKTFNIEDDRISIYDGSLIKTDVACGINNGSIKSLFVYDPENKISKTEWLNANGDVIGNTTDIESLTAGSYTLKVSTTDGCETKYGPVILKNTTGPNINQTSAKVQSTNCGEATGSITNISVTGSGTLKYSWTNEQQQQIGTDKDLLNQPAGTYKLQVTDDTQCGPIYTTDIVIPETNGITLDESKVQTSIASCSQNNGSITGITFSGATKFQWIDANNQVVATTADLKNAASGDYTFTASNNFGCSKTSKVYHVDLQAPVQFPQYAATIAPACFKDNDGSINVVTNDLVKAERWVNSQGATVGNQASLLNTPAGTYQLYLTDQNGCENYYKSYIITESAEYIVADYGQHIDEQCGLKNGSITGVNITGGIPPYTYTWLNAANQTIGSGNTMTQLAAGTYILNVVDTRCGNVDITYTITDESADIAAPLVSDLQLCSSGSALLIVNNASLNVTYRLYNTQSSIQPIDEQKGGKFNITVNALRSYFVSQLNGTCESPRAEVKVAVGLSVVNIANTITPNGDGINDYWKITSIENYPDAIVQVFSRYGQKVYESKGYSVAFDGNLNGKKLSAGVYYYIINLRTNCNILSGSLTVIR